LSQVIGDLQRAAGATERLMELLHAESAIESPQDPDSFPLRFQGRIQIEQLRFHYPSRPGHAAVAGLTLEIEAGSSLALVGPSGAGKSTLFDMLLRFYDPQGGRILIDSV